MAAPVPRAWNLLSQLQNHLAESDQETTVAIARVKMQHRRMGRNLDMLENRIDSITQEKNDAIRAGIAMGNRANALEGQVTTLTNNLRIMGNDCRTARDNEARALQELDEARRSGQMANQRHEQELRTTAQRSLLTGLVLGAIPEKHHRVSIRIVEMMMNRRGTPARRFEIARAINYKTDRSHHFSYALKALKAKKIVVKAKNGKKGFAINEIHRMPGY